MTVEEVVAKVFQLELDSVTNDMSRDEIEGWDSMGHLSLVTALEEAFKIQISIADAMEMGSVTQIKGMLRKYGVDWEQ
jgi:acyl carrier protein